LKALKGENPDEFHSGQVHEGKAQIYKDSIDQYIQIIETLKKKSSMAIHDDRAAQNSGKGGKLLLIDPADYGTQHIFFDDSALE